MQSSDPNSRRVSNNSNVAVVGPCLVLVVIGLALVSNRLLDMADVANEQGISIEDRKDNAKRNDEEYTTGMSIGPQPASLVGRSASEPARSVRAGAPPDLNQPDASDRPDATRSAVEIPKPGQTAQAGNPYISRMRADEPVATSRPRPDRTASTPDYFGSLWVGFTPEQKFGAFVEAFWSFARQNTGSIDCPPIGPKGIRACLAEQGFRFESSYPSECKVTLTEFVPRPANLETTWDGKIVGKFAVARSLTIDLRTLNPTLINNSLKLYFNVKNHSGSFERRIVLSSEQEPWLTIPVPPTLSDIPTGSDERDRSKALRQSQMRWGQEVLQKYGSNNNLPYFSFFDTFSLDPSVSDELRDTTNLYYVLSPPNLMQPVQLFSPNSGQSANALFVDALKSVIAKCPYK